MLYGRGDDCELLTHALIRAQGGASTALVLRGEAGVGKTALVHWLSHEASQMEIARLSCAGVESESDLAFSALHQLLRPAISAMPTLPRLQQEALNGALGLSGRRGVDPFLVAVGALSLLGELAAESGLVCIVDDAQWLDPASMDVLRFVARRLDAEGIALIFAARDPDPATFDSPGIRSHRLEGLDHQAAGALLRDRAAMISPEVERRLVEHHAGNPLAIIELAPLLTDAQLSGRDPLPDPMPMGGEVEHLYASRAAGLTAEAQRLLLLAAIADTDEVRLVVAAAAALGLSSERLEEAEVSGLISVDQGAITFKHPLVRSAIHQRSTFRERQQGHQAMAALLTDETDVDRRAWHLVRAATGYDDELADLLEASAARATSRGGPASAVERWQWSAELTTDAGRRCDRLIEAAASSLVAAQPDRSRHFLAVAEPLAAGPLDTGRVLALRGDVEMRHGDPEIAYDMLLAASAQLAIDDPRNAVEALVLAGEAATFLGDPRRTTEVGLLADQLRAAAPAEDVASVDLLVGLGRLFAGDWSGGSRILASVLDCPDAAVADFRHVLRSGRAAMYLGRLADARDLYGKAVVHARSSASPGQLTPLLDRLAYIELLLGRLPDAEAHASEGLRLSSDLGLDAGIALSTLATVYAYRGQDAECRAEAARAREVAAHRRLRMIDAGGQWGVGLLELGAGRPAEALSALLSVASATEGHPGILRWATPDLVEAAVRSRDPDACGPALERLEAWAGASGLPIPNAALARCRGLLATGAEAIAHLEEALVHDELDTRPLERARIQLLLGEALRRERQRVRSREHLRLALQVFDRMGARPWSARAESELRASGETGAPRGSSGAVQLTPQELQIAQYAAEGESNADIAAKLFLSRRTVEYHLAKVYTKLGVTSRRDLASTELISS